MGAFKAYLKVFATFVQNSWVRDLHFRANFIIEALSSFAWMLMNLGYYLLIFRFTDSIGVQTGWHREQFFIFLATSMFINSLVQTFFMPNAEEFSELIRTGGLDFALLKPIDTQFLISLRKMEWSSLINFFFGLVLLTVSLTRLAYVPSLIQVVLYPLYILCGVAILYSVMMTLAATSIWLGQNQTLYDFWFYITNFSRYPMEIYNGPWGGPLRSVFTFVVPILLVINVPARLMAMPLEAQNWPLAAFALFAAVACLGLSRWIFVKALTAYRSASS